MTAQAVETVVAQLADAGLNLSLAPAGGIAVAPSSHLTADLRDLIRSSKALLIDWLTAANDAPATHPFRPTIPWTGKSLQRPTTPTTSIAQPVLPPVVATDTGNAAALAWRCGGRIAIDPNPIFLKAHHELHQQHQHRAPDTHH